jgi:putative ABC transport system permease protein
MFGARAGSVLIRLASVLVPASMRREWKEEWLAELEALHVARAAQRPGDDLPSPRVFALGAFPHAFVIRTQEWTVDSLLQDLRYATRLLRRAPGFTLIAAATLALGIGVNGSIFSLVNGLVFRSPAGIEQPERLVQIARSYQSAPRWDSWSAPAVRLIGEEADALAAVTGYWGQSFVIGRGVEAEAVFGEIVTGNFFEVLGAVPHLGRLIRAADDQPTTGERVVVLSHALWSTRFGGDPGVVGQTIPIGPQMHVVVGVTTPGFTGPESLGPPPMLFIPASYDPDYVQSLSASEWGSSWIEAIGRLKDGVTLEQASASMDVVTARLRAASPIHEDIQALIAPGIGLSPASRATVGRFSVIVMAVAGIVLLLTCTNVATLFLTRASARRAEVGVRMTLGASRSRLGRQLLTEGLVMAALATAIAVPVVVLSQRALPLMVPEPVAVSLAADGRVFLFLGLLGIVAGVLFSAAPAWSSSRRDANEALREGATTGSRRRTRLRDTLVISQLALSLGLVAGAGLLGRSVLNARFARPGLEPTDITIGFIDPQPTGRYDQSNGRELYRAILEAAAAMPGVTSVTWSNQTALVGGHSRSTVRPADQPESQGYEAEYIIVGPSYFETMGIRVLRGRPLGGFDGEPEPVVVVNEALASMFWPDQDPVGKELLIRDRSWRVVGLVEDVQMRSLREAGRPGVYYPIQHIYSQSGVLQVKAEREISADEIRSAVAAVDPALPVTGIQSLRGAVIASMAETRNVAYLVGAFAFLALALASIGLYGLVSFGAAQRIREMGIRIALGAQPRSLVRLVLARAIGIAVLGTVFGVGVSMLVGRTLESLLFGVARTDGAVLGGAALVLLLVAGLAAWVPARRAGRVDASVSLRGG